MNHPLLLWRKAKHLFCYVWAKQGTHTRSIITLLLLWCCCCMCSSQLSTSDCWKLSALKQKNWDWEAAAAQKEECARVCCVHPQRRLAEFLAVDQFALAHPLVIYAPCAMGGGETLKRGNIIFPPPLFIIYTLQKSYHIDVLESVTLKAYGYFFANLIPQIIVWPQASKPLL